MSRSNSLLVSAFVVLLTVGLIQGLCTLEELSILIQCAEPFVQRFEVVLGMEGPCNRTIIEDQFCSDYASIALCFDEASISRETCRPPAVAEMETIFDFSCKAVDFIAACPGAPKLDTDGFSQQASEGTTYYTVTSSSHSMVEKKTV